MAATSLKLTVELHLIGRRKYLMGSQYVWVKNDQTSELTDGSRIT